MPPTGILESLPATESLGAERGGNPPEPQLDPATGAYHGPAGAFVYPGGAAWVPPDAAAWYATLPPEALGIAMTATPPEAEPEPAAEPIQATLSKQATPQAEPAARRRRRTTKQAATIDPGRLQGRIIAAERKAAKLERGNANERRQASAIRREAERLKIRLEMMQERYYSTEEAGQWQPVENDGPESAQAPHTPRPAMPESLPAALDWPYLKRLYQAGERRGIETHCALYRVDVGQVLGRLAAP